MEHKKLSPDDMPDFIDTAETLGFEHKAQDDSETKDLCDMTHWQDDEDEDSE